jgi:hypothetical protein
MYEGQTIEIKNRLHHFRIDPEAGKVWHVSQSVKGKREKIVESLMLWKGFTPGKIAEAYDYLSKTTRLPVWKLRKMSKVLEAQK